MADSGPCARTLIWQHRRSYEPHQWLGTVHGRRVVDPSESHLSSHPFTWHTLSLSHCARPSYSWLLGAQHSCDSDIDVRGKVPLPGRLFTTVSLPMISHASVPVIVTPEAKPDERGHLS